MKSALRLVLILLLPSTAWADSWTIDTSHSDVSFGVTHMLVSTVTGTFEQFSGTAETDADGKLTAVTGKVQIVSVNTRNDKRDKHLQADDFFSSASFPTATFTSTAVTPDGEGYKVAGKLTIRDVTKDVVFDVEPLRGPVRDRMGTTATTTIDRQDYGVRWSKTLDTGGLSVSNEVKLTLRIELKKAQ